MIGGALAVLAGIPLARAQFDNIPLVGNEVVLLNQGGRKDTTTQAIANLAPSASNGTNSSKGIVQCDGVTITCSAGVISAGGATGAGTFSWKRRTVASGSSDTDSTLGVSSVTAVALFWNSASGASKTEVIKNCVSGLDGAIYRIVDEHGDAGSHGITISPASAGTIGGGASYVVNSNNAGVDLVCDGSSTNWVPS